MSLETWLGEMVEVRTAPHRLTSWSGCRTLIIFDFSASVSVFTISPWLSIQFGAVCCYILVVKMVIKSRKPLWKNKESVQTQFVEKVVNLEQP